MRYSGCYLATCCGHSEESQVLHILVLSSFQHDRLVRRDLQDIGSMRIYVHQPWWSACSAEFPASGSNNNLPAAVSCTAFAAPIEDTCSPSGRIVRVAPAVGLWPSRFFRCTASAALLSCKEETYCYRGFETALRIFPYKHRYKVPEKYWVELVSWPIPWVVYLVRESHRWWVNGLSFAERDNKSCWCRGCGSVRSCDHAGDLNPDFETPIPPDSWTSSFHLKDWQHNLIQIFMGKLLSCCSVIVTSTKLFGTVH